jgi:hypothetical protein
MQLAWRWMMLVMTGIDRYDNTGGGQPVKEKKRCIGASLRVWSIDERRRIR